MAHFLSSFIFGYTIVSAISYFRQCHLKISPSIILIFFLFFTSGCARPGITIRILDRQTGQPIEDAAVLAWWNQTDYLGGVPCKHSCYIVEGRTDSSGMYSIIANEENRNRFPRVKIYKPNYVGWSDRWTYVGATRNVNTIGDQIQNYNTVSSDRDIYLEPWRNEYDQDDHLFFLTQNMPRNYKSLGISKLKYLELIESSHK
ncbi:MAG: hypothetical protein OEM02_06615 [Desulfobulbaceae bacterium]|nr:hypothetical protein [Desulfobulbaceae bacterium]